jgi:tetratricopeptide (TPR) repeat protein
MRGYRRALAAALGLFIGPAACFAQATVLDSAKGAYEKGDAHKAIEILKGAADQQPNNGEIQLWLTKAYLEVKQYDDAIASGEKAVSLDPKNSVYHQWLGEAYGDKADHSSKLSAFSWARKTHKEFDTAVNLDEHNFDADQDLIEYDCTAPSIVGGGEDKGQALIQKVMTLDPAEGHFGEGVCKAVKKDYAAADAEYVKALQSKPRTADRIYDIGDYFLQRGQGDKVLEVAAAGEGLAPNDPRGKYYQAVGWILQNQKYPDAEKNLRAYLAAGPFQSSYPAAWDAHYWLGRLQAAQKNIGGAKSEYQEALKLNPKYKKAEEALKQLGK